MENEQEDRKKMIMETIIEGRKMEAYAEHRTKDMKFCWVCENIVYKKKAIKRIGNKSICIDCLRAMKEALDNLGQWEEELVIESEVKKQLDEGLNL